MSLEELIFCLRCGEELDVSVCNQSYFIQPKYGAIDEKDGNYLFFKIFRYEDDEKDCQLIFSGSIEEIVSYRFDNKFTFKENIDKFHFFDGCYITEE